MGATRDRIEDWVLIHAWVEPGQQQLRVRMRRPLSSEGPDERRMGFTDAEEAAGFVREWLRDLLRRRCQEDARNGRAEQ
jgi:hypothetical protein